MVLLTFVLLVVILILSLYISHYKTIIKSETHLSALKPKKIYTMNKDVIFLLQQSLKLTKLLEITTADNENVELSGMKNTFTEMLIRAQSIGDSSFTKLYLEACKILKEEPEQV